MIENGGTLSTRRAPAPEGAAWRALNERAVVASLERLGGLRVTGEDRVDFLQGQLAADVRGLAVGEVRRSLALDGKGHALAEATVHRREHDLYVAVEDGALDWLEGRLRRHVIFDAVELEGLGETLTALSVQGPEAHVVLEAAGLPVPPSGRFESAPWEDASLLVVPRDRSAPGGFDVHLLRRHQGSVLTALTGAGGTAAAEAALEPSRIQAGLARAGLEAGPGVLPQEAGLEEAFSTRKGCYLGQEVMARIEARGRLKRGLAGLRLVPSGAEAGVAPEEAVARASGRALLLNGRSVGRVGGAAIHPERGGIALAVLRHDVAEGESLEVEGEGEVRAVRVALPFQPGT